MNGARFLQTAVLLVLLAGCSRVQLLYSQLDWLIPYHLETYMRFSEEQNAVLDRKVDALLTWHCGTQLSVYADLLRSANADFQAGLMTKERLGDYTARLEHFWREIMRQASPAIAELLLTASDEQIDGLFSVFKERNETWLADFKDQKAEERREEYRERMTDELERWFGPLQPTQRQAVFEWSERFEPLGLEGLRMRQRWQARLRELMDNRDDAPAFHEGIHELFVDPRRLRSPAIQERFNANKDLSINLVHGIAEHMSGEQKKHLANQTASVADDLDELACAPETAGATEKSAGKSYSPSGANIRPDP